MKTTSLEQSKKLLELGLNPNTADMIYPRLIVRGKETMYDVPIAIDSILYSMHTSLEEKQKSIPAWSTDALMSLMPVIDRINRPTMRKCDDFYCCVYSDDHCGDYQWFNGSTPVDAAFEMIVWLLEKNYIEHQ